MGGMTARTAVQAARSARTAEHAETPVQERESPAERTQRAGMLPRDPRRIPAESGTGDGLPENGHGGLRVGSANDSAEREAEAAARRVMGWPARPAAGLLASGELAGHPVARRQASGSAVSGPAASGPAESIPAASSVPASGGVAPAAVHAVLRSPGQALDAGTQRFMEAGFGAGFGHVRVHTGEMAAESARQVQARAYAVGRDLVFGAGEYRPETAAGRSLIAHELAHVVQAGGPVVRRQTGEEDKAAQGQQQSGGGQGGGAQAGGVQRAPVNDVSDNPLHETREISAFDVTPGNKRPWNLNKLVTTIVGLLKAEERAYIVVRGQYPVIAGEDDPKQAAYDRADVTRKALIQWIGPGKFPEMRFEASVGDGEIGDPQVVVEVAYHGKVISEGNVSEPRPTPKAPTLGPLDPIPAQGAAKEDDGDVQSAVGGQWAWHLNRQAKPDKTVQVQLTKGSGAAQSVYQFQINVETGDVQFLAGGQIQKETKTVSVLKNTLKLKGSVFAQFLGGISKQSGAASGSITFQVQAGAQVTATFGPITVAIQAAPSVTYQAGQPIAVDFGVAPQVGATQLPDSRKFPPFIGIPIIVGTF
jgi:hypothetical protein